MRRRAGRGSPATAASFASGAWFLVAARNAVALLGWSGTILIVHRLSPQSWGGFSVIFSVLGIVGMVADLRLGRIVMRQLIDATGPRLEQLLGSYVTFRFILGVVCYAVAVGAIAAAHYPPGVLEATLVAGASLLFASLGTALDLLFTARLWVRSMSVAMVLGRGVQFAVTVALYLAGTRSVVLFVLPAVLCDAVALGWRLRVLPEDIRLRRRIELRMWRAWLWDAAPLSVGAAMVSIYVRIDVVMVSKLRGLGAVGQYAIGYKFSDLVSFIPVALGGPLLATLSRAWPEDPGAFRLAVRKAVVVLTMAAAVLVVEFAFFSRSAIGLLYGTRYQPATLATEALVGATLLAFFSNLAFTALAAAQRNLMYPVAGLVGLVVNVGLNLVLIPRWSYDGAALVTVLTEAVVGVILLASARPLPGFARLPWALLVRTALSGLAAAGAAALAREFLPWEVAGVMSVAVYGAALVGRRAGGDLVELSVRRPRAA